MSPTDSSIPGSWSVDRQMVQGTQIRRLITLTRSVHVRFSARYVARACCRFWKGVCTHDVYVCAVCRTGIAGVGPELANNVQDFFFLFFSSRDAVRSHGD